MKKYPRTLIVGDPHAEPGQHNKRFNILGNLIVEKQYDNVIIMGDFNSFDSLSDHDEKRPLLKEGRRFAADIEHGKDALLRIENATTKYNDRMTAGRHKQYRPNKIMLNGNHEDRAGRYVMSHPELAGIFDTTDLIDCRAAGWKVVPYKAYYFLQGVGFTHIPMARRDGNSPLGGEYVTRRVCELHSQTIAFAHTHRFTIHEMARNVNGEAKRIMAINCGWFGDFMPGYAKGGQAHSDWWAGVVELTHLNNQGDVDISTISMQRLKAEYL